MTEAPEDAMTERPEDAMTENDPLAHVNVGDPDPCPKPLIQNGPFCKAFHPRHGERLDASHSLYIACTRAEHSSAHIAAAGRPEHGQYVGDDGLVHPGPSGRVGGTVAVWHEATR